MLLSVNYTYDANGNITTAVVNGKNIKYYYNDLNELTREDNEILSKTITYSYDDGGNIVSKNEYALTSVENPANPTLTTAYAYTDSNWKDKLTSYDGKDITYDNIGNPTNYNGWTFAWEQGMQLSGMSKTGMDVSFKYNDSGIRTQKTVNGVTTNYYLDGDKVTYEDNGTDKIYYTYDASGNLVSMNLNGVEYYYIRNAQGDIIGLFDNAGIQVISYTYDTWGKLISIGGTLKDSVGVKNPYRYKGYMYDTETGLYYLQSRYYDPQTGRWINADDVDILNIDQGHLLQYNLFAYSFNNPVTNMDYEGYFVITATVCLVTSIIMLVAAYGSMFYMVNTPPFRRGWADMWRSTGSRLRGLWDNIKAATDSGKNERHGDSGRALESIQKQIEELQRQLERATNKKEKAKIKKKIENLKKEAQKKKKGESHSQRAKH